MAQSVKRPTLDFSSGHDLAVRGIEPHLGLHADSVEPASLGEQDNVLPTLSMVCYAYLQPE